MTDPSSRERVEELYGIMSVYNGLFSIYARRVIPPALVGGSMGVIVAIFMSLSDLNLPFVLAVFYRAVAVSSLGVLFGAIYECVCITRMSERILGNLLSTDQKYLQDMASKEREAVMKRAKVFRPVLLPLGGFCSITMGVAKSSWHEIVNQVFFLFSL